MGQFADSSALPMICRHLYVGLSLDSGGMYRSLFMSPSLPPSAIRIFADVFSELEGGRHRGRHTDLGLAGPLLPFERALPFSC